MKADTTVDAVRTGLRRASGTARRRPTQRAGADARRATRAPNGLASNITGNGRFDLILA